jgi:hypothetical protein
VKSRAAEVQATVDRNLAEREARQNITDEVLAKRKQTAALEAKVVVDQAAAVTSSEQMARTEPGLAKGKAADIVDSKTAEADALEKAAAVTSSEQMANAATAEIINDVMKKSNARELREIEMHNAQMDSVNSLVTTLSVISNNIREVAEVLDLIRLKE